ncbi:MAG: zinc ribbon domain-containing protein [Tannerella sp.]|nr:zinc ribbon domain-containing protein [Tannerella sp.]
MRCRNCGWDNPENSTRCVKCNQPLHEERNSFTSPGLAVDTDFNSRKTVSESLVFSDRDGGNSPADRPDRNPTSRICYNCKSAVASDYYFCPECGAALSDKEDAPGAATPDVAAPKVTMPGGAATPKVTMPGSAIPNVTIPGGAATPKATMPGSAIPNVTIPGGAATPKATIPGSAIPNVTMPGGAAAPKATMPGSAIPNVTIPG